MLTDKFQKILEESGNTLEMIVHEKNMEISFHEMTFLF